MAKNLIFLSISFTLQLFCQTDISHISIKFGSIANFQNEFGRNDKDAFTTYPEFEVGGNLFSEKFHWNFITGYWDDGIEKPFAVRDYQTISHRVIAVGLKIGFVFKSINISTTNLDLIFIAGIVHNFIRAKNISQFGNPESNDTFTQPYLGLKIKSNISSYLFLTGEIGSHASTNVLYPARPVFLFGVGYNFSI